MDYTEMYHTGVLGMKWGIKKTTPTSNSSSPDKNASEAVNSNKNASESSNPNKDKQQELKTSIKNRRLLSNDEIREKIERIKLEREFKNIANEDLSAGRKIVEDVLKYAVTEAGKKMLTGALMYGTRAAMTKQFSLIEAADYVVPKSGSGKKEKNK